MHSSSSDIGTGKFDTTACLLPTTLLVSRNQQSPGFFKFKLIRNKNVFRIKPVEFSCQFTQTGTETQALPDSLRATHTKRIKKHTKNRHQTRFRSRPKKARFCFAEFSKTMTSEQRHIYDTAVRTGDLTMLGELFWDTIYDNSVKLGPEHQADLSGLGRGFGMFKHRSLADLHVPRPSVGFGHAKNAGRDATDVRSTQPSQHSDNSESTSVRDSLGESLSLSQTSQSVQSEDQSHALAQTVPDEKVLQIELPGKSFSEAPVTVQLGRLRAECDIKHYQCVASDTESDSEMLALCFPKTQPMESRVVIAVSRNATCVIDESRITQYASSLLNVTFFGEQTKSVLGSTRIGHKIHTACSGKSSARMKGLHSN